MKSAGKHKKKIFFRLKVSVERKNSNIPLSFYEKKFEYTFLFLSHNLSICSEYGTIQYITTLVLPIQPS